MAITAQMVKELREKTGVGMMDCKTALQETNGDIEAAVDWLRSQRPGEGGEEGRSRCRGRPDRSCRRREPRSDRRAQLRDRLRRPQRAVPAARLVDRDGGPRYRRFASRRACCQARRVRDRRGRHNRRGRDDRREHDASPQCRRFRSRRAWWRPMCTPPWLPGSARSACWSAWSRPETRQKLAALGRQVAMHIAAANPLAVDADGLDAETVARERAVFAEQSRQSGKPEAIIEKMVDGRMRKFYEESVLLKQVFVIDGERTVEAAVKAAEADVGGPDQGDRLRRLPTRRRRGARGRRFCRRSAGDGRRQLIEASDPKGAEVTTRRP